MPTLQLDVTNDLLKELERSAVNHNQSVGDEAVCLLRRGLQADTNRKSQADLLAELRRRSYTPPAGTPDSLELLREDRGR